MTELINPREVFGSSLSLADLERIEAALASSRSASTTKAYASAWDRWSRWCTARGAAASPAEPALIAAYIAELASVGKSISTVDKALAAIRAEHLDAGLPDPASHPGLARVRAGLRRTVGVAPLTQAHPLTTAEVRRIVGEIDPASTRGLRDRALILLGFAGALRRSEIVGLDVRDVAVRARGLVVTIRRSKGDQEAAGQFVGVGRGERPATDPVAAVLSWLDRANLAGTDALFCPISRSDRAPHRGRLDGKEVNRILVRRASSAGLGDLAVSGHSLRAGHATTAAANGVPADRLARTTRHRNLATLARYVRPSEVLADTTSTELGL